MKLHELAAAVAEAQKHLDPNAEVMVKGPDGKFFRRLDVVYDYDKESPLVLECYTVRGRLRPPPAT